jgi:Ala-tRNA(Pro) deacylase
VYPIKRRKAVLQAGDLLYNNIIRQYQSDKRGMKRLDKKGLYDLLDQYQMTYEACEHPAVYTIEEMDALNLPHSERVAKNLFLRDDKKQHYYLVTVPGHKTVNLKSLSEKIASRKLTFASEESLRELLILEKGHVTPLGVLNNEEKNVIVVFDKSLQNQQIGIHPMENTATIFMAFEDVEKLVEDHGNPIVKCDFE